MGRVGNRMTWGIQDWERWEWDDLGDSGKGEMGRG